MTRARHAAASLAPAAIVCALALALFGGGAGCKRDRKPIEIEAGPPLPEATADLDAKETLKVIVSRYPLACDASAASRTWTSCRESGSGYGKVYACAERALRESRAALSNLQPSKDHHAACANEVDKAAVAMLNATPKFFADVTQWLQAHHDALVTALEKMPLGEACRASKTLCAKEPHDYDDAYKTMRMHEVDTIQCTNTMFRCGQKDNADCWLANVVTRVGVACQGVGNRAGATPDDLIYVRETGTPLAR